MEESDSICFEMDSLQKKNSNGLEKYHVIVIWAHFVNEASSEWISEAGRKKREIRLQNQIISKYYYVFFLLSSVLVQLMVPEIVETWKRKKWWNWEICDAAC